MLELPALGHEQHLRLVGGRRDYLRDSKSEDGTGDPTIHHLYINSSHYPSINGHNLQPKPLVYPLEPLQEAERRPEPRRPN